VVKRGQVIVGVFGGGLGNKPRPAVVVQNDWFETPVSILALPLTSEIETGSIIRPLLQPSDRNGLIDPSVAMADKLCPLRKESIGEVIGTLSVSELETIEIAMQLVLGFPVPLADLR
jgi:mRNA interferase MazF